MNTPSLAVTNNTQRILTGVIGAPLVLGVIYLGSWPFAIILTAAALLAQRELYTLMEMGGLHPQKIIGMLIGAVISLYPLLPWALPLAVTGFLFLLAVSPFQKEDTAPLQSLAATLFGIIYPVAFLAALLALRTARGVFVDDLEAFYLTLTTFLLIWATDTFAYFIGRSFGRHKLAPAVSPKKTWEGSIGGAAGALLVMAVLKPTLLPFLNWGHAAVIALICGVVSQLGDLAESKLKRSVGAKDSGNILPGHGGLLDRLDGMILSAPLVFLYLDYVAGLFNS